MLDSIEIARHLLAIKAIHLSPDDPFTWASGIKSPIYCDNRQIISYPELRKEITNTFVEYIKKQHTTVTCIAGTATAGIPHAALIADRMNLPLIYVRSSNKTHGRQNAIEGHTSPDEKIILIEDLFSTGGSSAAAADLLLEQGHDVLEIISIFTYELDKLTKTFASKEYEYHSLSNITALLKVAVEDSLLTNEQAQEVKVFLKSL